MSHAVQIRLQRPTISAEMSFLLAVMKFYIPDFAIASVTPIPFQTQDVLLTGRPCNSILGVLLHVTSQQGS